MGSSQKTVVILSVSSDIGKYLAKDYLTRGWNVIGTYRRKEHAAELLTTRHCRLFACDLSRKASIAAFIAKVNSLNVRWDIFISCAADPLPVQPFFQCDFDRWNDSVSVNCIEQLRVLRGLYPSRNHKMAHVVFFAGGGMNNPVRSFSAYTASKIFLTKMCEFLDLEEKRMNIFIVGPGWTRTKIHQTMLNDRRTDREKVKETKVKLKSGVSTSMADIAGCIDWLCAQGKRVAGGRNFSVVYDPWRLAFRKQLIKALRNDKDMYKLRRQGNHFLQDR